MWHHQNISFPPSPIAYDDCSNFLRGGRRGKCSHILYFYCELTRHFTKLMSDAAPEHASRKRLLAGCHVSGSFGELIPNPDPNKKRCIHKCLGNVLHAVGHSKYMVAFDNGETFECCSNRLHVEARTSAIPPDVPPEQAVKDPLMLCLNHLQQLSRR